MVEKMMVLIEDKFLSLIKKDKRCRSKDKFFGLTREEGGCCDKDKVFFIGLIPYKEDKKS